jgi:hypothetical protein
LARFDAMRYGLRVGDVDGASAESVMNLTREVGFGKEVKRRIILGTYALSSGYYDAYYGSAQKVRTLITQDFTKAFEGQLTATDINHAYWAIAYNLKIISAKTYEKGLDNKLKSVRLAALSTLGASKKYYRIKKGVITSDVVLVGGNEALTKVYTLIRLTCFEYMYQVKRLLKKDFICYKTDCIYYIDSKENKKIVRDFFKSKKLGMKQLEKPK